MSEAISTDNICLITELCNDIKRFTNLGNDHADHYAFYRKADWSRLTFDEIVSLFLHYDVYTNPKMYHKLQHLANDYHRYVYTFDDVKKRLSNQNFTGKKFHEILSDAIIGAMLPNFTMHTTLDDNEQYVVKLSMNENVHLVVSSSMNDPELFEVSADPFDDRMLDHSDKSMFWKSYS